MNFPKWARTIPALLALTVISACAAGTDNAAPATVAPPAAAPTAAGVRETPAAGAATAVDGAAPAADAPVAQGAPIDWLQTASVDGDYFILGNPDAPVRVLDFSDFL